MYSEPVQRHFIAHHPQVGADVHFEVGRELKLDRVSDDDGRVFSGMKVVAVRVPTTDRVLGYERVEQHARVRVHDHGSGLHANLAVAQMPVLVRRLQHARVHREHPGAGHGVEVEGPVTVRPAFGQGQPEHAVVPFHLDAAEVEPGGHRVEIEIRVFQPPRRVVPIAVHDDSPGDVGQVGERPVAGARVDVCDETREPRGVIDASQTRFDNEPPYHLVRVQIDYEKRRIVIVRAVSHSHVDHPKPVARVQARTECVNYLVGRRLFFPR